MDYSYTYDRLDEIGADDSVLETQNVRSGVDYTYASKTNYITKKSYMLTASDPVWSTSFTYGQLSGGQMPDRVYTVSNSNGLKAAYTYDDLGRRTAEAVTRK